MHDNPFVEFHPCDRTNDTAIIRVNDKVTAINSALEVDLSGQVVADSIGFRIYSGIGGQMDFIHGAALSAGGKPIIALPSMAAGGTVSRIVPASSRVRESSPRAATCTGSSTEYGAVNLFGLTLRQRAEALIRIAHPDARGDLDAPTATLGTSIWGVGFFTPARKISDPHTGPNCRSARSGEIASSA